MKRKWLIMAALGLAVVMSVTGCKDDKKDEDKDSSKEVAVGENVVPMEDVHKQLTEGIEDLVELGQYLDLEVTIDNIEVTDEQVDSQVNVNLQAAAEPKQLTEGTVADGDTVNIDYVGKIDGVEFDGGKDSGYDLTIGSDAFIDGFEDGLIGATVGSSVDVKVTFPEDYTSEEVAGKDAVFTVKVNYLHGEKVVPELTDDWVVDQALDGVATVDQYKAYVRSQLEDVANTDMQQATYTAVMDKIKENCEVKGLAKDMDVQKTIDEEIEYAKSTAVNYGYTYDDEFITLYTGGEFTSTADYEAALPADVETYYDTIMIYRAIAIKENITITEEEYIENVTASSEYYANYGFESPAEFEETYSFTIYESAIYTAIEDKILESAIVTKK